MYPVPGTPITIDGRSTAPAGQPGQATTAGLRVDIPLPLGRQFPGDNTKPGNKTSTFARYLRISNVDNTNSMNVYFLNSNVPVVIAKGTSQEFSGNIPYFIVQGNVAPVDWEAFAVVAA